MIILVMGVAGSGKTTIGSLLAQQLGWQFADADDFHSAVNRAKMQQGIPLTDGDRQPWLQTLRTAIIGWLQTQTPTVLACSALKAEYRQLLFHPVDPVKVVYLKGSNSLLQQRLQHRHGHYMKAEMLQSQLETLEEPQIGSPDTLQVDIRQSPAAIVQIIRTAFEI